jgi:uncharacterized membrane protein
MAESSSGFEFNRPTIVALLYLASLVTGLPILIGLILSYIWNGEDHAGWEASHYRWFIRTFWISIAWGIIGVATFFFVIGMIILALGGVWIAVRSIKALLAAQKQQPVTNVETWLW